MPFGSIGPPYSTIGVVSFMARTGEKGSPRKRCGAVRRGTLLSDYCFLLRAATRRGRASRSHPGRNLSKKPAIRRAFRPSGPPPIIPSEPLGPFLGLSRTKRGPFFMKPADALPLRRIDHVRFFLGNARQSAYFSRNAFGFDVIAYAGLETGLRNEAGYVLRQGHITFVLASPLSADHPENRRLGDHAD